MNKCKIIYHTNIDNPQTKNDIKANEFTKNLLMPKKDFVKKYNEYFNAGFDIEWILNELSLYFGCSKMMTILRMQELNLITAPF